MDKNKSLLDDKAQIKILIHERTGERYLSKNDVISYLQANLISLLKKDKSPNETTEVIEFLIKEFQSA